MIKNNIGKQGENHVADYLTQHGFTILQQNYRQFFGEIDIIARKQDLYVFVEVKTRKSSSIPLASLISPSKQKKIIKTAQQYIATEQLHSCTFRFDAALIEAKQDYKLTYIQNAFTQSEESYGW